LDAADYLDLVSGHRRGFGAAIQRAALHAATGPYALAVGVRNRLFDWGWRRIHRTAVPVVSVGNLTVGGTGKTPCVEYIARFYSDRDWRVAILSRGYGSNSGPNDEALLLEENLPAVPHLQAADRMALATSAVEELESEVLVLDDGFQHRRLGRTLDLVLIDSTQPWGFGHLLPRGLLRESPRSLRRATAVLLTRCDAVPHVGELTAQVRRYAPAVPVIETVHRPLAWVNADGQEQPVEAFRGRPALAFCGIGNPESFRRTLEQIGITVTEFRPFPDHFAYGRRDVDGLERWAEAARGGLLLTTQKDLVKLRVAQLGGRDLWALRIGLAVRKGEDELHTHLLSAVTG
jgi:tetraacyldisaccharide 4'-kinase